MTELQRNEQIAPVEGPEGQPPLEVAVLTWEYPPIPSAKGRVACEVAHGLAHHGANVRVFTMDRSDRVSTDHERIEVIGCANRITGLRRLMKRMPGLDHIAAAAAFRERVHEEHERKPFDLIEATNNGAPASMLMDCGLPIVIRATAPGAMDGAERSGLYNRISTAVASGLEARCIQKSDAVVSNSRAHAGMIKDWYDIKPGHVHSVTPLSVDPGLARQGARAPYPPAHAKLRIARIGTAGVRSGFTESILAFDAMVRQLKTSQRALPELHLIGLQAGELDRGIAGLPLADETREQLLDHGRLPDRSMGHVLARCQFVMAPSRYQSTGSVYNEAAAFGRPLIASAEDPTAKDFIRRYACGVLAGSCSPEDIASATLALFDDRERQLTCRHAGLTHSADWSREALGARTIQAYRRAMNLEEIELPGLQPARESRVLRGRFAGA